MLLIGEGALQLTVQALSIIISEHLIPVIFIINNDGYKIDRKIHGKTALYNGVKTNNVTTSSELKRY